ncbi:MAG: hypothetical protein ACI3XQ_01170, partial [Eubacteriales bacterium]
MKKTKLIIAVFMVLSMLATASVLAFADDTTPLTLDQIIEKDLPAAENEEDDRVEIDFSQGELDSKWVSNVKDAYSIKDGVLEVSNSVSSMTIKYLPGTELASATKYVWSFDYKVVTFPSSSGELVCEFVSSDVRFLIYFIADGSVKIGYNSAETHNLGIKAGEWHNFTVTRDGNIFSFYIDGVYFTDIYNTKDSKPFEAAQAFGMHYISIPGV